MHTGTACLLLLANTPPVLADDGQQRPYSVSIYMYTLYVHYIHSPCSQTMASNALKRSRSGGAAAVGLGRRGVPAATTTGSRWRGSRSSRAGQLFGAGAACSSQRHVWLCVCVAVCVRARVSAVSSGTWPGPSTNRAGQLLGT